MQALRRRAKTAISQTHRRARDHNAHRTADLTRQNTRKTTHRNDVVRENRRAQKRALWEEWHLGDGMKSVGLQDGGTKQIDAQWSLSPSEKKRMEKEAERKEEGGDKARRRAEARWARGEFNVVKGDRIVVKATEGPVAAFRGQIGTVLAVRRQEKVCVVEGWTIRQSRAPKLAPKYTLFNEPHYDPDHPVLLPIPFSHMRIVKTIINDAGEKEDVILGRLAPADLMSMGRGHELSAETKAKIDNPAAYRKARAGQLATTAATSSDPPESDDQRLAREQSSINQPSPPSPAKPSTTAATPAPPSDPPSLFKRLTSSKARADHKAALEAENDTEDPTTAADTPRLDVDAQTWTPTLLRAPLPGTIIDELRGKYSVFRTRHDDDFVKRLQRGESRERVRKEWVKTGAGVLSTPREEAVRRGRDERKREMGVESGIGRRAGGREEAVLEGIGRVMWERGMRLSGRGEVQVRRVREKRERRGLLEGKRVDGERGRVEGGGEVR